MNEGRGEGVVLEPQRRIGYLLRRAQQLHVAAWSRIASTEISSVQFSILAVLHQRGEASQRELCDAVDLDRSTMADLVARMERRGLLERRRAADDARRNVVTLTEHGTAEYRRLDPLVVKVQESLVESMTAEEQAALRLGLEALLDD